MERRDLQYLEMIVALLFLAERGVFQTNAEVGLRKVQTITMGLDEAMPGWRRETKSHVLRGDGSPHLIRHLVNLAGRGVLTSDVTTAFHTVLSAINPTQRQTLDKLREGHKYRDSLRLMLRRYPALEREFRDMPDPENGS